jgi:membrane associated rhomboid family serine protease
MERLRLLLSILGLALFAACFLGLMLGASSMAFAIDGLSWAPRLSGWLGGALLLVLLLRAAVIRLERRRKSL